MSDDGRRLGTVRAFVFSIVSMSTEEGKGGYMGGNGYGWWSMEG